MFSSRILLTLGKTLIITFAAGAATQSAAQDDLVPADGVVIQRIVESGESQKQSLVFANNRGRLEVIDGANKGEVSLLDFASQKAFVIDEQAKETLLSDFPEAEKLDDNDQGISYKPEGAIETVAGMSAAKFSLQVEGVTCATVYTSLELANLPAYNKYLREYLGSIPTDNSLGGSEADACAAAAAVPIQSMAEFGAPVLIENKKGEAIYKIAALIPSGLVPVALFGLPDFPVKVLPSSGD